MSNVLSNAKNCKSALVLSFDTPSPADYGGIYDVVSRANALREQGFVVDYVGVAVDKRRLSKWKVDADQPHEPFRRVYVLCGRSAARYLITLTPASAKRRNVPISVEIRDYLTTQKYSVVLVDHIKMVPFAQRILPELDGDIRLRMHNDEAQYYASLARNERNLVRAGALWLESVKYSRYQRKVLNHALFSRVYFISQEDQSRLSNGDNRLGCVLPVVANFRESLNNNASFSGRTIDCLYVGNLDLQENINGVKSALQYLQSNDVPVRTVQICGRCNSIKRQHQILAELKVFKFCDVKFNVSPIELNLLYQHAKFFLNFSMGFGGVKTKLIEALAQGLVVITNEFGVRGSGLEEACIIASKSTAKLISVALTVESKYEQLRKTSARELSSYESRVRAVYKMEFGATE